VGGFEFVPISFDATPATKLGTWNLELGCIGWRRRYAIKKLGSIARPRLRIQFEDSLPGGAEEREFLYIHVKMPF